MQYYCINAVVLQSIPPIESETAMPSQTRWRYCNRCMTLFYAGHRDTKGVCPARLHEEDTGHVAQGFVFDLTYNDSRLPSTRSEWRNCWACQAMFRGEGDGISGRCPAGGKHNGHADKSFNFWLPYNVGPARDRQDRWRQCRKCQVMFYNAPSDDGNPSNDRFSGVCTKGGAHEKGEDSGYDYALPHLYPTVSHFEPVARDGALFAHIEGYGFTTCAAVEIHPSTGGAPTIAETDDVGAFHAEVPARVPFHKWRVRVIDTVTDQSVVAPQH